MTQDRLFIPRSLDELAHEWPKKIDHISASSLKMALRCEEQWRQRYILGRKQPPNLNMLGGLADHATIEQSLIVLRDDEMLESAGVVRERFVNDLETRVEAAGGLTEIEIKGADDKPSRIRAYDKARIDGQVGVVAYQETVTPTLWPVEIEESFEIEVPNLPVRIDGRIDLTAFPRGNDNEPKVIIDRKRTVRTRNSVDPEWAFQAAIYQLVMPLQHQWHVTSVSGKGANINTDLTMPLRDPERTKLDLEHACAKIGFLYQRYGPDEPWPATGQLHPWACGYCGYRSQCWAWKEE